MYLYLVNIACIVAPWPMPHGRDRKALGLDFWMEEMDRNLWDWIFWMDRNGNEMGIEAVRQFLHGGHA